MMMEEDSSSAHWLVVGIAGATCSGKTILAKRLQENLKNSVRIAQDNYFFAPDDPRHVHVPELNHINWDLLTSLDMAKIVEDVRKLLASGRGEENARRVLILDGFLLFNCEEIFKLCDLRYFLETNLEKCWERRKLRIYDPPDVPNYFQMIVWPEYLKSRAQIFENKEMSKTITFIDTSDRSQDETFTQVFGDIEKCLQKT